MHYILLQSSSQTDRQVFLLRKVTRTDDMRIELFATSPFVSSNAAGSAIENAVRCAADALSDIEVSRTKTTNDSDLVLSELLLMKYTTHAQRLVEINSELFASSGFTHALICKVGSREVISRLDLSTLHTPSVVSDILAYIGKLLLSLRGVASRFTGMELLIEAGESDTSFIELHLGRRTIITEISYDSNAKSLKASVKAVTELDGKNITEVLINECFLVSPSSIFYINSTISNAAERLFADQPGN